MTGFAIGAEAGFGLDVVGTGALVTGLATGLGVTPLPSAEVEGATEAGFKTGALGVLAVLGAGLELAGAGGGAVAAMMFANDDNSNKFERRFENERSSLLKK